MLNLSEYRQRPALLADWLPWAGLVTARPGLPMRVIVNRDLVLRPYQPLFFVRGAQR